MQSGITGSLWVINIDGSRERQVMSGAHQPKSPTWSADGQKIIISMQNGGTVDDTWMCMIDGKPVESPAPIEGQRCMPQRANPYWGLRVVDVSSGAYEDIQHDVHSMAPTWDPANAWHVIYRGDRGLTSLDLNLGTTWLAKANGSHRGPAISPDGTKIATTYKQNVQWEVHVMNVDGSGEVRLTETPMSIITEQHLKGLEARVWNNAAPAWSPDGSQIAFITDRNGSYEIWVMNADGSNQRALPVDVTINYTFGAEQMITLGKSGDLGARRQALAFMTEDKIVQKVFDVLARRYATRPGGYVRLVRLGVRRGDASEMAQLELVE